MTLEEAKKAALQGDFGSIMALEEHYSKRQRILLIQSGELRVESGVIAIQILDKIRI